MGNIKTFSLKIGECTFNITNTGDLDMKLQPGIEPYKIVTDEVPFA
ncbi:MAG: hypothetical protein ACLFM7_04140 [Bacteroidales bacterium]